MHNAGDQEAAKECDTLQATTVVATSVKEEHAPLVASLEAIDLTTDADDDKYVTASPPGQSGNETASTQADQHVPAPAAATVSQGGGLTPGGQVRIEADLVLLHRIHE